MLKNAHTVNKSGYLLLFATGQSWSAVGDTCLKAAFTIKC